MSQIWKGWFDVSAEQRETIEMGGYYTALLKPRLRLVSLNTDYGYAISSANSVTNDGFIMQVCFEPLHNVKWSECVLSQVHQVGVQHS